VSFSKIMRIRIRNPAYCTHLVSKVSYKYTHKTFSYRISRLQNVQVTKRPIYKTSRLQHVQETKRPVFVNLKTCLKKPYSQNMSEISYFMRSIKHDPRQLSACHWVPTTKPNLSQHKVGTHPWSASPMDRTTHGCCVREVRLN
jgi:hypothetical protein